MKMRSRDFGAEDENRDNPFMVNDPEVVWEEWKKKAKLTTREALAKRIEEAKKIKKKSKKKK